MSCLLQKSSIVVLIVHWLQITHSNPLFQGFSIQKGFEVNLKPFEFKPISFFKEKWTPFGRFGSQKGIHKRDLGIMTDVSNRAPSPFSLPPAPVFEQINEDPTSEKKDIASNIGLHSNPESIKSIESNLIRIPLSESFKPPTEGLFTSIGRNLPMNNYISERPAEPVIKEIYGELPPRSVEPIPETTAGFVTPRPINIPPQPVSPIPTQPAVFIPPRPGSPIPARPLSYIPASFGQTAGVTSAQPSAPIEVIPLFTPPPPPPPPANVANNGAPNVHLSEIPPTEGPLLRGSRVALYFGNVFLQLVSQFLTNARLQFSQFKQPTTPPVPVSN